MGNGIKNFLEVIDRRRRIAGNQPLSIFLFLGLRRPGNGADISRNHPLSLYHEVVVGVWAKDILQGQQGFTPL